MPYAKNLQYHHYRCWTTCTIYTIHVLVATSHAKSASHFAALQTMNPREVQCSCTCGRQSWWSWFKVCHHLHLLVHSFLKCWFWTFFENLLLKERVLQCILLCFLCCCHGHIEFTSPCNNSAHCLTYWIWWRIAFWFYSWHDMWRFIWKWVFRSSLDLCVCHFWN